MNETYTLNEIKEKLEHEKYLRKENQELYEELQVLRKCSDGTNDLANEYKKRIDKAIETIKDEGLVVAIKIINEKNDETLLSSKDLLIDILKGSEQE